MGGREFLKGGLMGVTDGNPWLSSRERGDMLGK